MQYISNQNHCSSLLAVSLLLQKSLYKQFLHGRNFLSGLLFRPTVTKAGPSPSRHPRHPYWSFERKEIRFSFSAEKTVQISHQIYLIIRSETLRQYFNLSHTEFQSMFDNFPKVFGAILSWKLSYFWPVCPMWSRFGSSRTTGRVQSC